MKKIIRGHLVQSGHDFRMPVALLLVLIGQWLGGSRILAQAVMLPEDATQRQIKIAQLDERLNTARQQAIEKAREKGWLIRSVTNDRVSELIALIHDQPIYYINCNENAAISTAADQVRYVSPYNLNGLGITVGVWDGGSVRATHREFTNRVNVIDAVATHWHATHVAGTIAAAGFMKAAKGMAPEAAIDSYEWTDDIAEVLAAAATAPGQFDKIYLSNHSYSIIAGWIWGDYSGQSGNHWFGIWGERESEYFGQYSQKASDWDDVCYYTGYYLPFKAIGNDRDDSHPSNGATFYYYDGGQWNAKEYDSDNDPFSDGWDNGGYDTIPYVGCAKNIMTVGAVNDAVVDGSRSPVAGTMSSFSCWGPTDDGRIKPDIVANGVNLYSTDDGHDVDYRSVSGTSMASPNACGSAALLVQYYNQLNSDAAMRSSTLKGLIIHTADDLGSPGPDYRFGWGLMNTKAAADLIYQQYLEPSSPLIIEGSMNRPNDMDEYEIFSDGAGIIKATLCWTDPPGSAKTGLDNPISVLVNDLDLRIIGADGSTVYFPFVLDPGQPDLPATQGDNLRDNVEQVLINPPVQSGTCVVRVYSQKKPVGNIQYYSLIISQEMIPPSNLYTEINWPGQITLHWQDNSLSETGFIIQRKPYHGIDQWHHIATVSPDTDAYVDTNDLAGLVTYGYRVGAMK